MLTVLEVERRRAPVAPLRIASNTTKVRKIGDRRKDKIGCNGSRRIFHRLLQIGLSWWIELEMRAT